MIMRKNVWLAAIAAIVSTNLVVADEAKNVAAEDKKATEVNADNCGCKKTAPVAANKAEAEEAGQKKQ
jgi:hypothetical protein